MRMRDGLCAQSRIHSSWNTIYNLSILEVLLQVAVIGKWQARTADSCQSKDMLVVGLADSYSQQRLSLGVNIVVNSIDCPSRQE